MISIYVAAFVSNASLPYHLGIYYHVHRLGAGRGQATAIGGSDLLGISTGDEASCYRRTLDYPVQHVLYIAIYYIVMNPAELSFAALAVEHARLQSGVSRDRFNQTRLRRFTRHRLITKTDNSKALVEDLVKRLSVLDGDPNQYSVLSIAKQAHHRSIRMHLRQEIERGKTRESVDCARAGSGARAGRFWFSRRIVWADKRRGSGYLLIHDREASHSAFDHPLQNILRRAYHDAGPSACSGAAIRKLS